MASEENASFPSKHFVFFLKSATKAEDAWKLKRVLQGQTLLREVPENVPT
jgi:hypothetical protein